MPILVNRILKMLLKYDLYQSLGKCIILDFTSYIFKAYLCHIFN